MAKSPEGRELMRLFFGPIQVSRARERQRVGCLPGSGWGRPGVRVGMGPLHPQGSWDGSRVWKVGVGTRLSALGCSQVVHLVCRFWDRRGRVFAQERTFYKVF